MVAVAARTGQLLNIADIAKDTGLASYLVGWDNAQVLQNGAMSGAFFETFVIGEIIKSWANKEGVTPNMNFFFYRDKDGNEIDLLIKSPSIAPVLHHRGGFRYGLFTI